jgi:arsenate reductase-like glutaredoxin family protein
MEIVWSAKAKITFYNVLDYLEKNWTKKEILQFYQKTQLVLNAIKRNPGIFPFSSNYKNIRKAIVDKTTHSFTKLTTTIEKFTS